MLIRRQQLVFPSAAGSAGGPNFPSKLTMAAPLPRRLLNEPDEDESGKSRRGRHTGRIIAVVTLLRFATRRLPEPTSPK